MRHQAARDVLPREDRVGVGIRIRRRSADVGPELGSDIQDEFAPQAHLDGLGIGVIRGLPVAQEGLGGEASLADANLCAGGKAAGEIEQAEPQRRVEIHLGGVWPIGLLDHREAVIEPRLAHGGRERADPVDARHEVHLSSDRTVHASGLCRSHLTRGGKVIRLRSKGPGRPARPASRAPGDGARSQRRS